MFISTGNFPQHTATATANSQLLRIHPRPTDTTVTYTPVTRHFIFEAEIGVVFENFSP